jgi:beta-glucosidase
VVVVGETPYAEGFGEVGGPQWGFDPGETGLRPPQTMMLNDAHKAAVDKVCAAARSCTVIVVSGRPAADRPGAAQRDRRARRRLVAGQRGQGRQRHALRPQAVHRHPPMTWPRKVAQEPIDVGDANYDPLYPFGWGRTTRASDWR